MEDLLKVHPKAYNKVYILYYIILSLNFILFITVTINYCLSFYALNYMEENYPNINITGLDSFEFVTSLKSYEYSNEMPNLGTTGNIYLDCYYGECHYTFKTECYDPESGSYECTKDYYYGIHDCSNNCRITKGLYCKDINCNIYFKSYKFEEGTCYRYDKSDDISHPRSCNADNLILNWKKLYYIGINSTKYGEYSYLKGAVPFNESCPSLTRSCGFLDDLGNKFCLYKYQICPINFITLNESEIKEYDHYEIAFINGKKIYYTNEATETGRVIEGLFVDTDLMIKYNTEDCKILDTSTISELLQHNHNKLYRESLDFDPYDEEKDDLDKRGKSYLKACVPGYGKEKNISKIKELMIEYKINVTYNEENIKPIKLLFIISYFVSLPGYVVSLIFLLILLFSFYIQNRIVTKIRFGLREQNNKLLIIILIISYFLIISGAILSFINNACNLSESLKIKLYDKIIFYRHLI